MVEDLAMIRRVNLLQLDIDRPIQRKQWARRAEAMARGILDIARALL